MSAAKVIHFTAIWMHFDAFLFAVVTNGCVFVAKVIHFVAKTFHFVTKRFYFVAFSLAIATLPLRVLQTESLLLQKRFGL